jgi:MFS family permease
MTLLLMFLLDLVAIGVMVFGLYFPRHRRKDMVVAYLAVNLGLLAVTSALSADGIGIGIGFGLFAVLSIIRLRSAELDQQEVAYYFAALALGLLGGLAVEPAWVAPVLMGAVLAALFVGDSPRLFARYRVQTITLDASYTDERLLIARLEELLGAKVHRIKVRRVDLVEATTTVEARYELAAPATEPATLVRAPAIGGAP